MPAIGGGREPLLKNRIAVGARARGLFGWLAARSGLIRWPLARNDGWRKADLLEQSYDAVFVWEHGGTVVYWNKGAEQLYGWSGEEALGSVSHVLLRTLVVGGHDISDIEATTLRTGRWEGELLHTGRDGRSLTVQSRWCAVPSSGGKVFVLETNRDITAQKAAERARSDSEACLRAIIDTAVEAIITIDERGIVQSFNRSAERMFGYRAAEVVGRNATMLQPETARSEHAGDLAKYREPGETHILGVGREIVGLRKDGTTFPLELGVSEVEVSGRRIFTGTLQDITERKRHEEYREQLLDAERSARTEAERSARLRDEFVATLSHELRTPLTAILGWVSLARKGLIHPDSIHALEVIERNARSLSQMVSDLLDVSRVVAGKFRFDVEKIDLAEILEQALASIQPAVRAKRIRLEANRRQRHPVEWRPNAPPASRVEPLVQRDQVRRPPEDR